MWFVLQPAIMAALTMWLIVETSRVEAISSDGAAPNTVASTFFAFGTGFMIAAGLIGAVMADQSANLHFSSSVKLDPCESL